MADEYVYRASGVCIEKMRCIKKTRATVTVEVTKFRVLHMNDDLTCETEKYVATEKFRRHGSGAGEFFDTWEQAHAYLDAKAADRVKAARRELSKALLIHGEIALIRKP